MTKLEDLPMPYFDYSAPQIYQNPYQAARDLARNGEWIARTATGYLLLDFDDCSEVSRDRRYRVPEALGFDAQGITSGLAYEWASEVLLGLDGAAHTRLRGLANKTFSRRSAEQSVRPFAGELIRRLVDPWAEAGHGVVEDFSNPYAIRVICHMLGLPDEDWALLADWADHLVQVISVNVAHEIPAIEKGIAELDQYISGQIRYLERHPNDSLGSSLAQARDGEDRLSTKELARLFESLLMAGSHTTQNQIALGLYQFVKHPQQWAELGRNPDLADAATEEVLRYRAPIIGSLRQARENLTLRGNEVAEGTVFTLCLPSANFDQARYEHADAFDIHRYAKADRPAVPHQSFGGGPHLCIGAHLARVEISEAYRYMAQRLRNLRFDPEDEVGLQWSEPYGIHGPSRTPIAFDLAPIPQT